MEHSSIKTKPVESQIFNACVGTCEDAISDLSKIRTDASEKSEIVLYKAQTSIDEVAGLIARTSGVLGVHVLGDINALMGYVEAMQAVVKDVEPMQRMAGLLRRLQLSVSLRESDQSQIAQEARSILADFKNRVSAVNNAHARKVLDACANINEFSISNDLLLVPLPDGFLQESTPDEIEHERIEI